MVQSLMEWPIGRLHDVSVVINCSFPLTVEDYVHRVGRSGRAGQAGEVQGVRIKVMRMAA